MATRPPEWYNTSKRQKSMSEQTMKQARKPRSASSATKDSPSKPKGKSEHPIAAQSGIFKDDPLWDEFLEAMKRACAKEDAETV
jgi:hypothetical protein